MSSSTLPAGQAIGAVLPPCFAALLRRSVACAILLLSLLAVRAQEVRRAPLSSEERAQGFSNGTILAKPIAATDEAVLAERESREGLRLTRPARSRDRLRVLKVTAGASTLQTIERLRSTGLYEFVEPDFIVTRDALPNDPVFLSGEQWALQNVGQSNGTAGADISAVEAWDIQSSAENIIVAVIDSGLRGSADLLNNLWVNPGESDTLRANGRDDDGNGYVDDVNGINALAAPGSSNSGNPYDDDGHGTAVTSIIGSSGDNGIGMTGVAWRVKLMPLRFMDGTGAGLISDKIECIDYAIAKGAHIINASSGGTSFSQTLFDALKRARDAGIIVVCAAGNDGANSDLSPHYPSNYLLENVVAVANTTRTDALSTTSTYSPGIVELGAPGTSIVTATADPRTFAIVSGTSFSAPFVSGALALVKAKFPGEPYRSTINRVLRATDAKPALLGKTGTGGRLNLAAALRTTEARPFNDDFARRSILTGEFTTSRGSSHLATREPSEPAHGATGNGSLWWSWTAPRDGNVSIETTGSAVDTTLGVYTGTSLASLTSVASNDDQSGTVNTSKVSFATTAGTTYQIAIDRKGTATGLVVLRLATLTMTTPLIPPTVFTAPANQTVVVGSRLSLSVTPAGTVPFTFQWLRNGVPVAGATSNVLTFDPAKLTDSGSYSVRISNVAGSITSSAAEVTVNPVNRVANLSIRAQVGGNAGPLTLGLTIGGDGTTGTKPLLARAVGPTLGVFGVSDALADPQLAMLSGSAIVVQNDNWNGSLEVTTTSSAVGAFPLPDTGSRDAALAHVAAPGGYTVRISGAGNSSGVALAEVYDATAGDQFIVSTPRLTNVSALAPVGTGGDILIAGFSITGATPKTLLIRGIGPTLGAFGVGGVLTDPKLDIYQSGATTAMATNDNWGTSANATEVAATARNVGAFALDPASRDAVLLIAVPPGSYTAQISGVSNTTGTALVEIYEVP